MRNVRVTVEVYDENKLLHRSVFRDDFITEFVPPIVIETDPPDVLLGYEFKWKRSYGRS